MALRKNPTIAKLTIREQQPWPVKLALAAVVVGLGAAFATWTYDQGRNLAGFNPKATEEKVEALQKQVDELSTERDKLARSANTAESQFNIQNSTQTGLANQVKALTEENQKLKDDLSFFESLIPTSTGPAGISIQRIKVEMVGASQLRYRVLVMQGGKPNTDFNGELLFSLSLVQAGKPVMISFPVLRPGEANPLKLSFRYYQRMEGLIPLPDGAVVKTVQAKIMDRGQTRAQQSTNL
jgi:hypothetical protein